MKVTYNLVCNFLCGLRRHLTCFLHAVHLPLHVPSDGRWKIKGGVSAPGLGCFLQSFLLLFLDQLFSLENHIPHETTCEGQCFVSKWPTPSFKHHVTTTHNDNGSN